MGFVFFAAGGADSADGTLVLEEGGGLGVDEFSPVFKDPLAERLNEIAGVEMAVLREPNSAFGVDAGVGFEFLETRGVEDFGFKAKTMSGVRDLGFFVQSFLGLAEHEEPFFHEGKVFLFGKLDMESAAFQSEVSQEAFTVADVLGVGVPKEEPDPAGKGGVEAGAQEERALGVEHPFQYLADHSGGSQRSEVAGHDHPGIAIGATAEEGGVLFDNTDGMSVLGKVVADGEADDAPTNDEGVLFRGIPLHAQSLVLRVPLRRRVILRGLLDWSSSGRALSGKFCQLTARVKRLMAPLPTEVLDPSEVAG